MSDISLDEWMELTRPQSPLERENIRLRNELIQANKARGDAVAELGRYKHMFELGLREGENQWRLPREVALAMANGTCHCPKCKATP